MKEFLNTVPILVHIVCCAIFCTTAKADVLPVDDLVLTLIAESIAEMKTRPGAQVEEVTPKYKANAPLRIPGPLYLISRLPNDRSNLYGPLGIFGSSNPQVVEVIKTIEAQERVHFVLAPKMQFTGLVATRSTDLLLFEAISAGGIHLNESVDVLFFIGQNIFDRVMVHESQHVIEILSGRLPNIIKHFESLQSDLIKSLGDGFLSKARTDSGEIRALLLQYSYDAATELTAEKAAFLSDSVLKNKYQSFLAFLHSPAFYYGLEEKIIALNAYLNEDEPSTNSESESIFRERMPAYPVAT